MERVFARHPDPHLPDVGEACVAPSRKRRESKSAGTKGKQATYSVRDFLNLAEACHRGMSRQVNRNGLKYRKNQHLIMIQARISESIECFAASE
jgi:hypothetical protein